MNKRRQTPLTAAELKVVANLQHVWNQKKRALGLTQEKAAHAFGWSAQANVSQYLNGKITLGLETGLKFANLLEVNPSEINPEWAEYDILHTNGPSSGYERFDRHLKYLAQLSSSELDTIELMLSGMAEMKNRKKS